jgi:site-specific recombinase XerD
MANLLLSSWSTTLRARNRSQATIDSYLVDVGHLVTFLGATELTDATKGNLESFLESERDRGMAPATVARRYRSMQQFFLWLLDEEEVTVSPMVKMKPPTVVQQPPAIFSDDSLKVLLKACEGRTHEQLRDTAIIRLLDTTGIRAAELMGLSVGDIDLNTNTFTVTGKGNRKRIVGLLPKSAEALDRYLRVRRKHSTAATSALWLGVKGPLQQSALNQMLERRSIAAGIPAINPHAFRHRFAHRAKSAGMSDGDLMSLAGWKSPQMLHRYGASAAAERALDSHRRLMGEQ